MVFLPSARPESRRRRFSVLDARLEPLETRLALSTASAFVMESATTTNSHGVSIVYNVVTPPAQDQPLTFGVYRSAATTFDSSAIAVGSETIAPGTLDANGQPASSVGRHELTIPLANGLPLEPMHPDVLVVANPASALASGDPNATASFHVDTIGVVAHGGLQFTRYDLTGPPWEQIMAYSMRHEGYDTVIPFDWVAASNTAGSAAKQAPRLLKDVLAAVAKFPANDVVDIQFIGHSEGTVINDQTLLRLESAMPPPLARGWIEDTMLDPHAANTAARGQQYSVANNPLGTLAKWEIDKYQSKAKDPLVGVPTIVDQAQVFYQHTDAKYGDSIYNLWGQVPVNGPANYYNLTGDRVTHNGDTFQGITEWYQRNIMPTLGNGQPQIEADALNGSASGANPVKPNRPLFAGTTAPGSFIKVLVAPASNPEKLHTDGRAIAGADGTWSVVGQPILRGKYRVLAVALPPRNLSPRIPVVPVQTLGTISIGE